METVIADHINQKEDVILVENLVIKSIRFEKSIGTEISLITDTVNSIKLVAKLIKQIVHTSIDKYRYERVIKRGTIVTNIDTERPIGSSTDGNARLMEK